MSLPLRAILAFHTTAKTGSVMQAAQVLSVTPSAISQQIQNLENYIGSKLFNRFGRSIILTEAGERYFELIKDQVEHIDAATNQVRGLTSRSVLNVRISPTFATKWVLPRLSNFLEANPQIELRLDATNEPPNFARENIDLEIRHGSGDWAGLFVEKVTSEILTPLCSPKYAAPDSIDVNDLPNHLLIHSVKNLTQWPDWFKKNDVKTPKPLNRLLFDRSHMSIDMAATGAGLALESNITAWQEIKEGKLICPVKPIKNAKNSPKVPQASLWFVCPHTHLNRNTVQQFINWVKDELDKDVL